jgi:hypothetical protein
MLVCTEPSQWIVASNWKLQLLLANLSLDLRNNSQINEVRPVTLGSTHGVDESINIQFFEVQLSCKVFENDKII